ncbi:hypothetical protein CCH79_00019843, partial [Gambusia affinis]
MVTPDCAQEQKVRRAQVDRQRLIQRAESHLDDTSQNQQRSCSKVSYLDFTHLRHLRAGRLELKVSCGWTEPTLIRT